MRTSRRPSRFRHAVAVIMALALLAALISMGLVPGLNLLQDMLSDEELSPRLPPVAGLPIAVTTGRYLVAPSGDAVLFDWPGVRIETEATCGVPAACTTATTSRAVVVTRIRVAVRLATTFPGAEDQQASLNAVHGLGSHEFNVTASVLPTVGNATASAVLLTPAVSSEVGEFSVVLRVPRVCGGSGDDEQPGYAAPLLVAVQKRTEALFGVVSLSNISVTDVTKAGAERVCQLSPPRTPAEPVRRIEFIGDSITAGFSSAGTSPCRFSSSTEDVGASYAGQLVRLMEHASGQRVEWRALAWSGRVWAPSTPPSCISECLAPVSSIPCP